MNRRAVLGWIVLMSVILSFDQLTYGTCPPTPPPPPMIVRNDDGTYRREPQHLSVTRDTLHPIYRPYGDCPVRLRWKEEWTDYPERGGVYIRRGEP